MKYSFLIITLPLFFMLTCAINYAHAETETVLQAGITREITDYDTGTGSTVQRGGILFSIDDLYIFNLTAMQNRDSGDITGTWFIQARPKDRCFSLMLGNYSLHLGSGLLMGRKEFMRPDPFSRKASFTRDSLISGSQSGNPAYSFFGIASPLRAATDDLYVNLVPFYSMQRRFISSQQVEACSVSSSLATVNSKTAADGIYNSPVDIINRGVIADASIWQLFHFQASCFSTSMETAGGTQLLWEKSGGAEGISRILSCGIFAEYSDESISLFIEPVQTTRTGPGGSCTGHCTAGGISLRNSIFRAALNAKLCDKDFRSIYASGDSSPENIFDFSCALIPGKIIKTGAAFYTEKDLAASPGSDERKCFNREEVFASLTGAGLFSADIKFSRKVPLDSGSGDKVRQFSSALDFTLYRWLYLRSRCTAQSTGTENSWLLGCELRLMLLSYFSLCAGYTGVQAAPENPLYAVITPASENNMDIKRFVSNGSGYSLKMKYTKDRDSFFLRWCRVHSNEGTEYTAESACVLVF